jgi:hypothetical protein
MEKGSEEDPVDVSPEFIYDANSNLFDQEEFLALGKIAHAFREYRNDAEWEITRWEYNYSRQA